MARAPVIKAVVLDIGGVALSYVDGMDVDGAWEAKLRLPPGSMRDRVWATPAQVAAEIGTIPVEAFWRDVAETLGLDEATAFELYEDSWRLVYLDDRVDAWLRSLRPRYTVATLSNSWSDGRRQCIDRFGLDRLVDLMVFSAEEGIAKPDERIYRRTLDVLGGDVQPHEVLFVDDRVVNVDAAAALGMHALHSTRPEHLVREATAMLDRLGR